MLCATLRDESSTRPRFKGVRSFDSSCYCLWPKTLTFQSRGPTGRPSTPRRVKPEPGPKAPMTTPVPSPGAPGLRTHGRPHGLSSQQQRTRPSAPRTAHASAAPHGHSAAPVRALTAHPRACDWPAAPTTSGNQQVHTDAPESLRSCLYQFKSSSGLR